MMINKGEGKKLTSSYSWFEDLDVIKNFVLAVDEVADKLPNEVNVLGIGSGVGNLEYSIKKLLEDKYDKKVNLTISDRIIKDTKTQDGVSVVEMDNKSMPFYDKEFDIVVARSVTHYEKEDEEELKVLDEIKRVLKLNSFFITEAPYLSSKTEVDLMYKIHSLVSKFMKLKDYDELLNIHKKVFSKVSISENQPTKPLSIERKDFIKRYDISNELADEIVELIKISKNEETSGIWVEQDNFGWSVNYAILICGN